MSIPVFRKGTWIEYPLPAQQDILWSEGHLLKAASFYATALSQGVSQNESVVLAECFVNKEVYPNLSYSRILENKIEKIMGHVETT
jgi:hypothetical protein